MAESLEEFVNGTQTLATLTSGLVIVTNTGAQRALVKDIQISNPSAMPLSLVVGATTLVSGNTDLSLNLSGSEIIGASSSLQLKQVGVASLFNKVQTFRTGQTSLITPKTHFSGIALPSAAAAVAQTTITSALAVTPYFSFISAAGNYYYHNHHGSSTTLYKRAGGVNGTQTTFTSFGEACWSDGVRYIYGLTGNNTLKTLDTTTDTVTSVTLSPTLTQSVNTSYCHGAAMDGYCWVRTMYNDEGNLINAATGAVQKASAGGWGYSSGNANKQFVAMGKNTAGDYILMHFNSDAMRWWNIGPTLSTSVTIKASGNTSSPPFYAYNGSQNQVYRLTHIGNKIMFVPITTGQNWLVLDLTTFTTFGQTITGVTGTDLSDGFVLAYDSAQASSEAPSAVVRATGVKIS